MVGRLNVAAKPAGTPLALRATDQLYPLLTAIAALTVTFWPACTLTVAGVAVSVKVPLNDTS